MMLQQPELPPLGNRYVSRWGARCPACGQKCRMFIDASGYTCPNCDGIYRSRIYDAISRLYRALHIAERH